MQNVIAERDQELIERDQDRAKRDQAIQQRQVVELQVTTERGQRQ